MKEFVVKVLTGLISDRHAEAMSVIITKAFMKLAQCSRVETLGHDNTSGKSHGDHSEQGENLSEFRELHGCRDLGISVAVYM